MAGSETPGGRSMKFRLVDRIISIDKGRHIATQKAVSFEEFSLLKPWGRKGAFPETLILQFAVESACLLVAFTSGFQSICVLEEMVVAHFISHTVPGDILLGDIELVVLDQTHSRCEFGILRENKKIAKGTFIVQTVPLHHCFVPEDYMLMWREMSDETPRT